MQKIEKNNNFKPLLENNLDSNFNPELNHQCGTIFKKASKTYFYSSLFFPKKIREQINILYAFVRTADDFVDSIPANSSGFFAFKNYYLQNSKIENPTNLQKKVTNLVNLRQKKLEMQANNQNSNKSPKINQLIDKIENTDLNSELNFKLKIKEEDLQDLQDLKNEKNEKNIVKNLEFWQKIVLAFVDLEEKLEFEKSWTLAFLKSMENDLSVRIYPTIKETCEYIYGSASVIGFFMAKILKLPTESYEYAAFLGQSFQYINFIRDIAEDLELGRCYFPQNLLKECNLQSLELSETSQKPREFQKFAKICLNQYEDWQTEAEKGFRFFPKKYKIAIKTASDMYKWTAKIIAKDPFIVYQKKIKPQKRRVLLTGLINWLSL